MADDRLKKAWREWVVESSPDAAQAYCVEVARTEQTPCKTTVLNSIAWAELGQRHEAARDAIYKAAETYIGGEPHEVCLEELSWISECHLWVLGNASPSTMRLIAKVYENHGMELKPGNEEEAERDHERTDTDSGSGSARQLRLKRKARNLENKVQNLESQLKISQDRASRLQRDNSRLESLRTVEFDHAGLQENFRKLQQENERLAKIIQEQTRGKA